MTITFGKALKRARIEAGLRLRALGDAVGYSEAHVARLEKDQRIANPDIVADRFLPALGLARDSVTGIELLRLAKSGVRARASERVARLNAPTTHLPTCQTRFIGRTRERARLRQLIENGTRLISLVGPGGVGKTRLAVEVAQSAHDERTFRDGVCFVELAALTDSAQIAPALTAAIGAPMTTRDIHPADYLRDRNALIILDNCEQLLDGVRALVSRLQLSCPKLTVILTSRERLHMPGETPFEVPVLSLTDATQLFFDRVQSVLNDGTVVALEDGSVRALCNRLDRLPLAIELAASRSNALSPEEIQALIAENRFSTISDGNHGADPRHRTLYNLIDWSYSLLGESERMLLRRLSVFSGGWTLESAEAVCADGELLERGQIVNLLMRLIDKSLVLIASSTPPKRFALLDSIRSYAQSALSTGDEYRQTRARHLQHVADLGSRAEAHLRFAEQKLWRERLRADHDNIVAALTWAAAAGAHATGARLILDTFWYWFETVHWDDYLHWLRVFILDQSRADARQNAIALMYMTRMLAHQGNWEQAEAAGREALKIARKLRDHATCASTLIMLSWVTNDRIRGLNVVRQAVRIARQHDLRWELSVALLSEGSHLGLLGRATQAIAIFEECIAIARAHSDLGTMTTALFELCKMHAAQKDFASARQVAEDALHQCDTGAPSHTRTRALLTVGRLAVDQGDARRAAQVIDEAIALFPAIGHASLLAEFLVLAGALAQRAGDGYTAVRLLAASEVMIASTRIYQTASDRARGETLHQDLLITLDATAVGKAWREGALMTPEACMELARNVLDPLLLVADPNADRQEQPAAPSARGVAVTSIGD
jgi:predicted ATPase